MGLQALTNAVGLEIDKINLSLVKALREAASSVKSGASDAACTRWFGDNGREWKADLSSTLDKLASKINTSNIRVGYAPLGDRSMNGNAAAWSAPGGLSLFSSRVSFTSAIPGQGKSDNMILDSGFASLPMYLKLTNGVVDATSSQQSKFGTIVHELTHLLIGTDDVELSWANGAVAYGAKKAQKLANMFPDDAKRNAENWGIFVEATGIHKSS